MFVPNCCGLLGPLCARDMIRFRRDLGYVDSSVSLVDVVEIFVFEFVLS